MSTRLKRVDLKNRIRKRAINGLRSITPPIGGMIDRILESIGYIAALHVDIIWYLVSDGNQLDAIVIMISHV